ncbi:MAG: hypothetical protein KME32_02150 [Mojavia pulchra JT2-VF2]|uniref:Uncharacterized protein n=1 Tax=Mojavia pulchra JT2-VF2 TaxID=287848 RepID=A0A951UEF0_9NOST|nr:hypothetical protein [Mojavia pulchra JT2-VF2]
MTHLIWAVERCHIIFHSFRTDQQLAISSAALAISSTALAEAIWIAHVSLTRHIQLWINDFSWLILAGANNYLLIQRNRSSVNPTASSYFLFLI